MASAYGALPLKECRAFIAHELNALKGRTLTTCEHGRQNWLCQCLKEINALGHELSAPAPEIEALAKECIDEVWETYGLRCQFVINNTGKYIIERALSRATAGLRAESEAKDRARPEAHQGWQNSLKIGNELRAGLARAREELEEFKAAALKLTTRSSLDYVKTVAR
jgi:hypothetical protein